MRMKSGYVFLSKGWLFDDRDISSENEPCENGYGLGRDAVDCGSPFPLLESSEEDQEELPVGMHCMIPTSVREYTKKGEDRETEIASCEGGPPGSVRGFQYWQDKKPLCQDICIWSDAFIDSVFRLGLRRFLELRMGIKYEPIPAYDSPFPNFRDPQFGICNRMRGSYADIFADANVLEEVRKTLGDSSAGPSTMKFSAFVRTGYSDLVGTEGFVHDLLQGGWNNALQKPPRQKEPISSLHTDGLSTGHRTTSSGESSSGKHTRPSYARAPEYLNLGPFRLPKNPNRLPGPPTAEDQLRRHGHEEGAEREGHCPSECPTYDPWNVSNKAREWMGGISAPPNSRSSGSHLSSGPWTSVSHSAQEMESEQSSAFFQGSSDACKAVKSRSAGELPMSSGSIYGALGGIGYKAIDSVPGRAPGSSAQSPGAMWGQLKNNSSIPIKNGERSVRSGCTSFHTSVTSNGPPEAQQGPPRFIMEPDESSAHVLDDSELIFESGQSLENIRHQAGAYIEPVKCAICYDDLVWKRSLEVEKSRDGCERELVRLPCGHCFHRDCLAIWFSQGRCNCPYCRTTYLSGEHPWVNLLVQEGNSLRRYLNGSFSRALATERIPNVASLGAASEGPMDASYARSGISRGHINSVGSDTIQSSAGWSTVSESTQRTVLRRRRRVFHREPSDCITDDGQELSEFSSLGSLRLTAPPNADSFEDEYWERYSREIGEEGEGGWRELGQLVGEEGIFGGSGNTAWPHLEAYTNAGICGEHFYPESLCPILRSAVVRSTAPPRLRAPLLAAEFLESVSSDLTPTSPTHLSLLDSTIFKLNQFTQAHKEAYNEVPRGYTNNCSGERSRNTSKSDRWKFFPEAGHQTKQGSGDHRYTNTQAITQRSTLFKSRVFRAEDAGAESATSPTAPETTTHVQKKQAQRKGQFGFSDKGSSFKTAAPGSPEFNISGVSHNISSICDDTAVSLVLSLGDTKPQATAPGGTTLSSSDEQFSAAVAPSVTKMKLPFSPDISCPKSQEVGVRRTNHKGSKIPVLVKKAAACKNTTKRPWNTATPIRRNPENSPFKSGVSISSLRRRLFEKESTEERDGSPAMRYIGSRLSSKSMW